METTHSKNRRTKKPAPKIVVNEWDDVWNSFKESNETTTIEAMNAEGWKTLEQAVDSSGLGRTTIRHHTTKGKMDKIRKKVFFVGAIREMVFVRPKI